MIDFKPFVAAVQAAGPYGQLAAATLSALFACAQSKTRTDEVIASAMAGVKDRLPGFQLYQDIYSRANEHEQRLRKKIMLAYVGVLELAIEAAQHYMKSGFKRWGQATFNPEKFQDLAISVQDSVVAVRLQCEELLNLAVHNIRQQNDELLEQNKKLRADIARLQAESDDRNLRRLQQLLGLSEWSIETKRSKLEAYEGSLNRERADDRLYEAMYSGSIARYKQKPHFQDWDSTGGSAMLLVVGAYRDTSQTWRKNHCWMSPLALNLINHYQASSRMHAFYVFDVWEWAGVNDVVCDILLQLLRCQRQVLSANEHANTLSAQLESYQKLLNDPSHRDEEVTAAALKDAAVTAVQLFGAHITVYIVLDRIDRCKQDDRITLLNILIRLMEEASCCVKIFAVADRGKSGWDVEQSSLDLPQRARYRSVVEIQQILVSR